MATFLDLVNKVIEEGGSEMDSLSLATWDSAEAGRRNYPRFKRNVRDAWKMIQMQRLEWEFKDVMMNVVINPRLHIFNGNRPTTPAPGAVFEGMESGFRFTVLEVIPIDGAWDDGDAEAYIEFTEYENADRPMLGEMFKEVSPTPTDNVFQYVRRGAYDMRKYNPFLAEPLWDTFVCTVENGTPLPTVFVPWDNWRWMENDWSGISTSTPVMVTQTFNGEVAFYPQSLRPFRCNFVASTAAQILEDPEDVPANIPADYHDWIAWEALDSFARFDKNPDLLAYATKWTSFYRLRAERSLMPIPSWGRNRYTAPTSDVSP